MRKHTILGFRGCFKSIIIISVCSTATVSLKNEISVVKKEFAGNYRISDTVNGKPSWKSGENGIWYVGPGEDSWRIGYWCKLGGNDEEIYADNLYKDPPGGLFDNRNIRKYKIDGSTR